jgi:uncharacterized membrane protein YjjB (DUF3815 family)
MTPAMSLWAGLAVIGFAMVFSVPRRTLPGIVALAVLAHLLRATLLDQGASLPLASFAAATFVGLTAAVVAPRTGEATPIYAFAPVIPLIPGTYMYDALTGIVELSSGAVDPTAVVEATVIDLSIASLTIVALAVGAISPTLILGRRIARLLTASTPSEGWEGN